MCQLRLSGTRGIAALANHRRSDGTTTFRPQGALAIATGRRRRRAPIGTSHDCDGTQVRRSIAERLDRRAPPVMSDIAAPGLLRTGEADETGDRSLAAFHVAVEEVDGEPPERLECVQRGGVYGGAGVA